MGRSGAGKSTLLYQISLLDEPTSGEIRINGKDTRVMSERDKMLFRLAEFGYVFQDYALLPELTAERRTATLYAGASRAAADAKATVALERVGLGKRLDNLRVSFRAVSNSASRFRALSHTHRTFYLPMSRLRILIKNLPRL